MGNNLNVAKLGRWLCIQIYRNPRELQPMEGVHQFRGLLEEIIQLDIGFVELLSGAYRAKTLEVPGTSHRVYGPGRLIGLRSRSGDSAKWSRLGEVFTKPSSYWFGKDSIDGVGKVRAKEVILYLLVGEAFLKVLAPYVQKNPVTETEPEAEEGQY